MPKREKLEKPEKKVQKAKVYDSDSDDDVPQKRSSKKSIVTNHKYYYGYQPQQPQHELKSRSVSPKAIEKPAPKPVSIEAPRAVRPVVFFD